MEPKQAFKAYLLTKLVLHFGDDLRRIDHALQVLDHAEALLAEMPEADADVVMAVAVMHDFGIREAERLHGMNNGPMQEKYGPPLVKEALKDSGLGKTKIEEICQIVARHHSPPAQASVNFRILYESDWLVNAYDFPDLLTDLEKTERFIEKNFKTQAGKHRAQRVFLNDDSIFVKMGNVYQLMIDEEKRSALEKPYLLELAEKARSVGSPKKRLKNATLVTDFACGTGFHSRLLAAEGYRVVGIDFSRPMLSVAKKTAPSEKIDYRWGNLLVPVHSKQQSSLTLLLGNTLSLFSEKKSLAIGMKHLADATLPGGIVLIQVLNYARLKKAPGSAVVKHGIINSQETVLTKSLQPTDDGRILLSFSASQKDENNNWRTNVETTLLQPWSMKDIMNAAKKAGLEETATWGTMAKTPYDAASSSDCIIEFRTKDK